MVLSGARHLGKTTNARTFSDIYFDIERVEDLTRLDIEWGRHMRGEELVILDEIQHAPELFLRLRTIIDEQYGQNGRFLLTESFASPLIKSLEGGVIVCESRPSEAQTPWTKTGAKTAINLCLRPNFIDLDLCCLITM